LYTCELPLPPSAETNTKGNGEAVRGSGERRRVGTPATAPRTTTTGSLACAVASEFVYMIDVNQEQKKKTN
jgi:hypothetical protein